jgi:S1-C subfamily serine protease
MRGRHYVFLIGVLCYGIVVSAQDQASPSAQSTGQNGNPLTHDALLQDQPTETAILTIKTTVVTNDLSVKIVPKLALSIESEHGAPIQLSSSAEGTARVDLEPGKYRMKSTRGLDFESKHFDWDVAFDVNPGENQLELSSDNAKITASDKPSRVTDELSTQYKRLQNAVVTVWSEIGRGTGFIVDSTGLILTNQHVIGPSEYIAVQFDNATKISAVKLLADPERDIAVLWADTSAFQNAIVAPQAIDSLNEPAAVEGERVFSIGSPLHQRKIVTTGIVSKIEEHAIISDIHIDHGNSGGPLFNSLGQVIGITTFGEGRGVSGIVRIEEAAQLLADARAKMAMIAKPSPTLLPVEPTILFPIDAIKDTLLSDKFETKHYVFDVGDFKIEMVTPPLRYWLEDESEIKAAKQKGKRTKKSSEAVQDSFRPLDGLKNWAEYVGEYQSTFSIRATPKMHETGGSILRRSLVAGLSQGGYGGPATMRFKADFYRMRLKCGDNEVAPIQPGKIFHAFDNHSSFVNLTDATYEGYYIYPPDSISPTCGKVVLEIYSEKKPESAATRVLDEKTVSKVWADFGPYREAVSQSSKH